MKKSTACMVVDVAPAFVPLKVIFGSSDFLYEVCFLSIHHD